MFSPFSAGWLRTLSGVSPCGDLPDDLALVEIDRADAAVRRLDQRQPLHGQRRRRCRRRRRRSPSRSRRWSRAGQRPCPGDSGMSDARRSAAAPGRACATCALRVRRTGCGLGIERAARPVGAPAPASAIVSVASGPSALLTDWRREDRADAGSATTSLTASARSSGVKSIRSSIDDALPLVRRRLGRERLRRRVPSRPARRLAAPAAPRSARPAGRSRGRTRREMPAWSAARRP